MEDSKRSFTSKVIEGIKYRKPHDILIDGATIVGGVLLAKYVLEVLGQRWKDEDS